MNISWMPTLLKRNSLQKLVIKQESIDTVSGGRIKQCGGCKKDNNSGMIFFRLKIKDLGESRTNPTEANKKLQSKLLTKRVARTKEGCQYVNATSNFHANPNLKVIDEGFLTTSTVKF